MLPEKSSSVDVSIVVVSYNTCKETQECLVRLQNSRDKLSKEIIIVDNASRDGSAAMIEREFPDASLIANTENVGFGRANNQAIQLASGRHVLLLNSDAFVGPDSLQRTVAFMDSHDSCGILGVRVVDEDGKLYPSARLFPTPMRLFLAKTGTHRFLPWVNPMDDMNWDFDSVRDCDWVPGCYFLVRREVIDQVGLFDPRYFLYYEEIDLCFATKSAGWRVLFYPGTEVVHIGGLSASSEAAITSAGKQIDHLRVESEFLYFRKNHGVLTTLFDVFLLSLAEILSVAKSAVSRQRRLNARHQLNTLRLIWSTLLQTRLGARPTR